MKKNNNLEIFFMLWKEVVEHICDRGSPLKRLPNRSCSQAGFPPLRCFLWPGCRLKSAVRPVVSDPYLQVRAVDEVMVSLSLTAKQGRKFESLLFQQRIISVESVTLCFSLSLSAWLFWLGSSRPALDPSSRLELHPALSLSGSGCFLFVLPHVSRGILERWSGT